MDRFAVASERLIDTPRTLNVHKTAVRANRAVPLRPIVIDRKRS